MGWNFQGPPLGLQDLQRDLRKLGFQDGGVWIVHSSLSSLGWVVGGATTVVLALQDSLGESGTLVMPAATPFCGDPASWVDPSVSEEHWERIREILPLFDRDTTPTTLGAIPETFRTWPGTLRSGHPLESVCAAGPAAATITRPHPLAFSEGPDGPFGRLHELDAQVLLLGVGFNRCTALHYAESLVANRRVMQVRFPVEENGERTWVEVPNVADDNGRCFPTIGEDFQRAGHVRSGTLGRAQCLVFSMRALVEFATTWFESKLPPPA